MNLLRKYKSTFIEKSVAKGSRNKGFLFLKIIFAKLTNCLKIFSDME
jgi:hypothetical protein